VPAIPAVAVGAADPGNAYACPDWKLCRSSGYYITNNLMSGDQSLQERWELTFNNMQISSANSTSPHAKQHLPPLNLGLSHFNYP
jgi:hypothetical protein